jgi:hypothetical protein
MRKVEYLQQIPPSKHHCFTADDVPGKIVLFNIDRGPGRLDILKVMLSSD